MAHASDSPHWSGHTVQEKEQPGRAPVYASLCRRPYVLGLPQDAFFLFALVLTVLVIASRLDPVVLAGCGAFYVALLPILRKLFAKEPYLMEIIPRAMRYAERYPRQAKERLEPYADRVTPSVPMGRALGA